MSAHLVPVPDLEHQAATAIDYLDVAYRLGRIDAKVTALLDLIGRWPA